MSYVQHIEPRLTPHRAASPRSSGETLVEWCLDLQQELEARLRAIDQSALAWQPHEDANCVAITAWHVIRWNDVLATRVFDPDGASSELWHRRGWAERTGYDPTGIGYLGLGTLTGYTPLEMRRVPVMFPDELSEYLAQSTSSLVDRIGRLTRKLTHPIEGVGLSAYQIVSSTLQGSFGHLGEIDALVSLHERLAASSPPPRPTRPPEAEPPVLRH